MKSRVAPPTPLFSIAASCTASFIGGIVSLLYIHILTSHWDDLNFWFISIFSHCVLIAITLYAFREKQLNLNSGAGLFNTVRLALIGSTTALLLFVLGAYVLFGLIFTGVALVESSVAAAVYAIIYTIDEQERLR